jgi:CRP-like cAMP-binding protein
MREWNSKRTGKLAGPDTEMGSRDDLSDKSAAVLEPAPGTATDSKGSAQQSEGHSHNHVSTDPAFTNALLARLVGDELSVLRRFLEPVTLEQGEVLFRPLIPIEHVYFFESGLSSEIAESETDRIEVGCVGSEGLSGVPVLLGVESTPFRAFMQVGGKAWRVPSPQLRQIMADRPVLRLHLLRYAHVFMIQIAATALADGRFRVEQRLARWLLMCQDRLGGTLPLTHEFLALMLGVRRPSVTDALHLLEGKRLIKAERARIIVRDRDGLENLAGAAYGIPEREYQRLFGSL